MSRFLAAAIAVFVSCAALAHPGHPGRIVGGHVHLGESLVLAGLGLAIVVGAGWLLRRWLRRKP